MLDLMDVGVQRAFLVLARQLGSVVRAMTWSYLIGPEVPVEHRFTSETHEPGHGHEEWLPPVRVERTVPHGSLAD